MARKTINAPARKSPPTTLDASEVARFSAMATEWWSPTGKFRPLHKFNPVRLAYIRDQVCGHFGRDAKSTSSLDGLRLLDIGCGGGLLCEPMASLGADVVGADPSRTNIEVARIHAAQHNIAIDYRATTAEDMAEAGERFDVILNMEVVEHVADVPLFMKSCASMVKPGGMMIVATLNRTLKAYALAIIGAEYLLQWLPRGTHDWNRFVTPEELRATLDGTGLRQAGIAGVIYNPLTDEWRLGKDTDVNYMITATRPASPEKTGQTRTGQS